MFPCGGRVTLMTIPTTLDLFVTADNYAPLPCVVSPHTVNSVRLTCCGSECQDVMILDCSSPLHEFLSLLVARMDSRARCARNSEKARMTSTS